MILIASFSALISSTWPTSISSSAPMTKRAGLPSIFPDPYRPPAVPRAASMPLGYLLAWSPERAPTRNLSQAERDRLTKSYLGRTAILLREVIDTDPKLAEQTKTDADIKLLKSRPEFQTIMDTLVMPGSIVGGNETTRKSPWVATGSASAGMTADTTGPGVPESRKAIERGSGKPVQFRLKQAHERRASPRRGDAGGFSRGDVVRTRGPSVAAGPSNPWG